LSVEEAWENYQAIQREEAEFPPDEEPMWKPHWWPLLRLSASTYLLVACDVTPQVTAPVYKFSFHGGDFAFVYDSISAMLETITAAYATGAYFFDAEGHLAQALRQVAQLLLRYNPQRATWWLATVPGAHRVEDLVALMVPASDARHDHDRATKAFWALQALHHPQSVAPLLQALQAPRPEARRRAATLLGEFGEVRAVLPLLQTLHDAEVGVRQSAAKALGLLGDRQAVAPLLQRLHDPEPEVREAAIRALGELEDRRAVPALMALLPTADVPLTLGWALGELRATEAVPALLQALQSPDPAWRGVALTALEKIGDRRAVAGLLTALHDPVRAHRLYAVGALQTLGDEQAVPGLLGVLQDSELQVRLQAIEALGVLGDARALVPLMRLRYDADPTLRHRAQEAVEQSHRRLHHASSDGRKRDE
jgi:HEAT repeat protein